MEDIGGEFENLKMVKAYADGKIEMYNAIFRLLDKMKEGRDDK